jgi:hypothetical protein
MQPARAVHLQRRAGVGMDAAVQICDGIACRLEGAAALRNKSFHSATLRLRLRIVLLVLVFVTRRSLAR